MNQRLQRNRKLKSKLKYISSIKARKVQLSKSLDSVSDRIRIFKVQSAKRTKARLHHFPWEHSSNSHYPALMSRPRCYISQSSTFRVTHRVAYSPLQFKTAARVQSKRRSHSNKKAGQRKIRGLKASQRIRPQVSKLVHLLFNFHQSNEIIQVAKTRQICPSLDASNYI